MGQRGTPFLRGGLATFDAVAHSGCMIFYHGTHGEDEPPCIIEFGLGSAVEDCETRLTLLEVEHEVQYSDWM